MLNKQNNSVSWFTNLKVSWLLRNLYKKELLPRQEFLLKPFFETEQDAMRMGLAWRLQKIIFLYETGKGDTSTLLTILDYLSEDTLADSFFGHLFRDIYCKCKLGEKVNPYETDYRI